MENIITIAKGVLLKDLPHDGVFVDYTMRDGYDALYMAKYVSEGNVVTFANDKDRIDSAYGMFESNFQDNAHIVEDNPVNVRKYVNGDITGFMLNAVGTDMKDKDIIKVVEISLEMMDKGRRGMITLDKDNKKAIKYVEDLSRKAVHVMQISMANEKSPNIYIVEKL